MRRSITVALLLLLSLATSGVGQARRGKIELRTGIALGVASTSVANETSTDVGPLVSGQVGVVVSKRSDLTADVAVQTYKANNPAVDESFTAVYGVAGIQVGLGESYRTYVRPELGVVFRSWSGSEVFVSSETSGTIGVALGRELAWGESLGVAAEVFVRVSGAEELSSTLLGAGLSIVPVGARLRAQ